MLETAIVLGRCLQAPHVTSHCPLEGMQTRQKVLVVTSRGWCSLVGTLPEAAGSFLTQWIVLWGRASPVLLFEVRTEWCWRSSGCSL